MGAAVPALPVWWRMLVVEDGGGRQGGSGLALEKAVLGISFFLLPSLIDAVTILWALGSIYFPGHGCCPCVKFSWTRFIFS